MRNGSLAVIVPLYNGAGFVGETLDSLAAQTVPLSEVIVVDDGSNDDGPEIARSHQLGPRVIEQANAGVAAARNRGALAARTRYIAFLDQDDLWLPIRHERILAFLDQNPGCRALATNEQSFYLAKDSAALVALDEPLHKSADHPNITDVGVVLERSENYIGSVPTVLSSLNAEDLLDRGPIALTVSYVFERDLFFIAGGCPPLARSMDDYWSLVNIARFTQVTLLDEPSVLYRIHPSSAAISTTWAMPLLTWLSAARFGGNAVPASHQRYSQQNPPLKDFWRHWLLALAGSGGQGVLNAVALTQLLASSRREHLSLTLQLAKRAVRSWLLRAIQSAR